MSLNGRYGLTLAHHHCMRAVRGPCERRATAFRAYRIHAAVYLTIHAICISKDARMQDFISLRGKLYIAAFHPHMTTRERIFSLQQSVCQIRDYYLLCKQTARGPFTLPRSMATYALTTHGQEDFHALLETLQQDGHIVALSDNDITFSPEFLNGAL